LDALLDWGLKAEVQRGETEMALPAPAIGEEAAGEGVEEEAREESSERIEKELGVAKESEKVDEEEEEEEANFLLLFLFLFFLDVLTNWGLKAEVRTG
jgi:hypothetical protein